MLRVAAKLMMYHGTSTGRNNEILHSILKQGLVPSPKKKAYDNPYADEDDGDGLEYTTEVTMRLDESLGGAYLTTAAGEALNYAKHAQGEHGGNRVLVSAQIETRTPEVKIDEDFLVNYSWGFIESTFEAENDDSYYYNLYTYLLDEADWKALARGWIEQKFPKTNIHDHRWQQVLPAMAKVLQNIAIIEILRNYEREIYEGAQKLGEDFEVDPYEMESAIEEYKDNLAFVSDKLKEVTTPTSKEMHNIRILKPVGYRGANHINAVVSWQARNYDAPQYSQIGTLHYARTPADAENILKIVQNKNSFWRDAQGNVLYDHSAQQVTASFLVYHGALYRAR